MATHSYIFNIENKVISANMAIIDAVVEYQKECDSSCSLYIPTPSSPYPENKEVWNILRLNVIALKRQLDVFLKTTEKEFQMSDLEIKNGTEVEI